MSRIVICVLIAAMLTACSPTATPTPEPTATPLPTETPVPATETLEPTDTPAPRSTPADTVTPEPTATEVVELEDEEPGQAATGAKPLNVTFTDLHYECQKKCISSDIEEGVWWGYRNFQTLMVVENLSQDLTLAGGDRHWDGWAPTRWIITDGASHRVEERSWQWVNTVSGSRQAPFRRPDLPPGATGEWTWMAFPLLYGEWVEAVEYVDEWGNLYRQDFPKPEGGEFNYVDCGDPKEGSC